MRTATFIAAMIAFLPVSSFAGGSVSWKEIQPILDQEPAIAAIVSKTLDCHDSGFTGNRIGGQFPLGGKRLGPYGFQCRHRGDKGPLNLLLTINTTWKLLDATGAEVDVSKATATREQFASIQVERKECKEKWCSAR